jgi:hypothetical protein
VFQRLEGSESSSHWMTESGGLGACPLGESIAIGQFYYFKKNLFISRR